MSLDGTSRPGNPSMGSTPHQPLLNSSSSLGTDANRPFNGCEKNGKDEQLPQPKRRTLPGLLCGVIFPLAILLFTVGYFVVVVMDHRRLKDLISKRGGSLQKNDKMKNMGFSQSHIKAGFAVFHNSIDTDFSKITFMPKNYLILPRITNKGVITLTTGAARMKLYGSNFVLASHVTRIEEDVNTRNSKSNATKIYFNVTSPFVLRLAYLSFRDQDRAVDILHSTCQPIKNAMVPRSTTNSGDVQKASTYVAVSNDKANDYDVSVSENYPDLKLAVYANYKYYYMKPNSTRKIFNEYNGLATVSLRCVSLNDEESEAYNNEDENKNRGKNDAKKNSAEKHSNTTKQQKSSDKEVAN